MSILVLPFLIYTLNKFKFCSTNHLEDLAADLATGIKSSNFHKNVKQIFDYYFEHMTYINYISVVDKDKPGDEFESEFFQILKGMLHGLSKISTFETNTRIIQAHKWHFGYPHKDIASKNYLQATIHILAKISKIFLQL
jgi:hypothetical protein